MSALHTSLVWEYSATKGLRRLILLALADVADAKGRASLSMQDIAAKVCDHKTAVERTIKALVEEGVLEIVTTGGARDRPNMYRLCGLGGAEAHPHVEHCEIDMVESEGRALPCEPYPPPLMEAISKQGESAAPDPVGDGITDDTEAPDAVQAAAPPFQPGMEITQQQVGQVLAAAGIEVDPFEPLYWSRREHRKDLAYLIKEAGGFQPLLECLRGFRPEGEVRRLTQLAGAVKDG